MNNDWILPEIDQQACTGCGQCAALCPETALSMHRSKPVFSDPQRCTYCAVCEGLCPVHAITCRFEITWQD
ncbi:MAG: FeS-binding protein [Chloroflexi bacterium HGW-Chloroflexi-10]|nr:MAG: FeS-binding protein [Chloroflexi bacterium HGW-Chloroflexi-10]